MSIASYLLIVSALADSDKNAVRESIGIDVDTGTVDRTRLEKYFARHKKALEAFEQQPPPQTEVSTEEREPLHCSFCHCRHTDTPYLMKLSDTSFICSGCIDAVIKGTTT